MELEEIFKPIEEDLERFECRLAEVLDDGSSAGAHLKKMQGKRLRPALVLLSSKAGERRSSKTIELAAAVELIHTATLIHDDVIDGAKVRRGLPALNLKFSKSAAILFGDYLYSRAFEMISALNIPEITRALLWATNTICRGEMRQLFRAFQTVSEKEYLKIIADKTASLFSACCETGAMLAGANARLIGNLRNYGHHLGMIFQITDDCLDLAEDKQQGKMTLPLIYIKRHPGKSKKEAIGYALDIAKDHGRQALKAVNNFEKNEIKESFKNLVGYILNRTKCN